MKEQTRRNLTEPELASAARLKAIYDRKKRQLGLSQEKLGEQLGGISQSAVGQYLNGKIPMSLTVKLQFARALKCDVGDFDPDVDVKIAPPLDEDEQRLLEAYRKSGPQGKELILGVALVAPPRQTDHPPED